MKTALTEPQTRALARIKAEGYAVSSSFRPGYSCAGQRMTQDMIRRLKAAGMIRGVVVRPGEAAYGFTNRSRVSAFIVVPVAVE